MLCALICTGFWALFWYRLSHVLLERRIPVVSLVVPRLTMSLVRYATAIDIHPQADIASEGILIDHGTGIVVGATAIIGGGVTMYHGVTLGGTGKPVSVNYHSNCVSCYIRRAHVRASEVCVIHTAVRRTLHPSFR